MRFSPSLVSGAAAALVLVFACDQTTEPPGPTGDPAFVAKGRSNHQSAKGHAVLFVGDGVFAEYTFSAVAKDGLYSGHVNARAVDPISGQVLSSLEGDVTCLNITATPGEPGSYDARMTALVTKSNVPDFVGWVVGWSVTDRGHGSTTVPDGASGFSAYPTEADFDFCTMGTTQNAPSDQNKIKVKP